MDSCFFIFVYVIVNGVDRKIEGEESDMDETKEMFSAIMDRLDIQGAHIVQMMGRMDTQEAKLDAQEVKMGQIVERLDAQEVKMGQIVERLDVQEAKLDAQGAKIEQIVERLDVQEAKLDAQGVKIEQIVERLDVQINEWKGDVQQLKKDQLREQRILQMLALRSIDHETQLFDLKLKQAQ
jgi:ABC-type transporter Mla subunit MlaD